ncbi:HI1506-related protein [Massilia sp. NR 4-1]|uniref:HI1506-related protein n=1 Tax=Massilia sp. NR 4-1 TaxID=1678028 RepID=UPI00067C0F10|nr:HI1506-related protein [Massilia sp. NR 4-1]AKU21878.1 hypothetical protein ACZ75_10765 [Massilia sp. NR 4-1]
MAANPKNARAAVNGTGGQGDADRLTPAGGNAAPESTNAGKSIPGLEVSSTRDGYRRGGRGWTKEPQKVPAADFTDEQRQALEWDSNIRVVEIDIPVTDEAE